MNARSTAFVRVCGCVLASVFALSFASEKAFAQTAAGHVFTAASGTFDNPTTTNAAGVNLTASITTIISDAREDLGSIGNTNADLQFGLGWQLLDRDGIAEGGTANDGMSLIVFADGVGVMQGGDLVNYRDPTNTYDFTVRLYNNADNVLFAADEVREADLATPADSNAEEFYLLTTATDSGVVWTTTTIASRGVFGYIAPNCEGDGLVLSQNGAMCEEVAEESNDDTPSGGDARTESKVRENAWAAFGGALAVGVLSYLLSDGTLLGYSATPDFGYSLTESGYSVNAGGRVDFRKARWHLYWTAGQQSVNGDFGDFRYSSGGKWQGDIFAAAFSEKVQGKTADYDLSLSANYDGGIWKLSPEFAIDSVYEKGEFATTNSFRINGEMRYDDWHFSASGNKTQMELSATLEF